MFSYKELGQNILGLHRDFNVNFDGNLSEEDLDQLGVLKDILGNFYHSVSNLHEEYSIEIESEVVESVTDTNSVGDSSEHTTVTDDEINHILAIANSGNREIDDSIRDLEGYLGLTVNSEEDEERGLDGEDLEVNEVSEERGITEDGANGGTLGRFEDDDYIDDGITSVRDVVIVDNIDTVIGDDVYHVNNRGVSDFNFERIRQLGIQKVDANYMRVKLNQFFTHLDYIMYNSSENVFDMDRALTQGGEVKEVIFIVSDIFNKLHTRKVEDHVFKDTKMAVVNSDDSVRASIVLKIRRGDFSIEDREGRRIQYLEDKMRYLIDKGNTINAIVPLLKTKFEGEDNILTLDDLYSKEWDL